MPTTKENKGPLVRHLVKATGLTRHGVYKCFREGRTPRNPLVARAWAKVIAANAKLSKAAP